MLITSFPNLYFTQSSYLFAGRSWSARGLLFVRAVRDRLPVCGHKHKPSSSRSGMRWYSWSFNHCFFHFEFQPWLLWFAMMSFMNCIHIVAHERFKLVSFFLYLKWFSFLLLSPGYRAKLTKKKGLATGFIMEFLLIYPGFFFAKWII